VSKVRSASALLWFNKTDNLAISCFLFIFCSDFKGFFNHICHKSPQNQVFY
jgi:hypothetical protein